jgi:hypothetical protein
MEAALYHPNRGSAREGMLPVVVVEMGPETVRFLANELGGLYQTVELVGMERHEFDASFTPSEDDLPAQLQIYAEHANDFGIGPAAKECLTALTTQPIEGLTIMPAAAKKTAAPKAAAATKPATPKAEKPKLVPKAEKPAAKRPSVSSRICELIMAGKLSDDAIFATVQKEFGLDDSKRGYVSWNRSHMRKQGVANVPDAVGMKLPAKKS